MSDGGAVSDDSPSLATRPFDVLLAVQRADTTLVQLHHRRQHLPEHDALRSLDATRRARDERSRPVQQRARELEARQASLDGELQAVEARIADADRRLFSGTITAPRELQALEADIASLKRRRSELEDAQIEVLIEREPVDAELADVDQHTRTATDEELRLRAAIAAAEAEIDAEAAAVTAQRRDGAAHVPAELLGAYERIRANNNGVGIARLEHGTCMSCRLKLPAVELDRLRRQPPDAVLHCEECGVILVR